MKSGYIIAAGIAVAGVVAYFVFRGSRNAEAKASVERLYGRKIPKIPPGSSWNPLTGQITSSWNVTTGRARF